MSEKKPEKGDLVVCVANWEPMDRFWLPIGSVHTVFHCDGWTIQLEGSRDARGYLGHAAGRFKFLRPNIPYLMKRILIDGVSPESLDKFLSSV